MYSDYMQTELKLGISLQTRNQLGYGSEDQVGRMKKPRVKKSQASVPLIALS
jgi:hypothetical protein